MTPRDFVYWLQGYIELTEIEVGSDIEMTPAQIDIVKQHLNLVFQKEKNDKIKNINSVTIYPEMIHGVSC